jgi:hypothetical protein
MLTYVGRENNVKAGEVEFIWMIGKQVQKHHNVSRVDRRASLRSIACVSVRGRARGCACVWRQVLVGEFVGR